jgi:hypothetical protein
MRALFYDRNSRPISELEWHRLGRRSGYRRVDYTDGIRHGRRITVVTYWLGIDDGQAPGQPLIFHTYAELRHPADQHASYRGSWAWPTLQAARDAHQAIATWLTGAAAWLAGVTEQRPGPALPSAITGLQTGSATPAWQRWEGDERPCRLS